MVSFALSGCGARMDVPITRTGIVGVDSSRTTPARGSSPELPQRTLPISVWMPSGSGPWPLIVFAHGYNTTPDDYASLLDAWAPRVRGGGPDLPHLQLSRRRAAAP